MSCGDRPAAAARDPGAASTQIRGRLGLGWPAPRDRRVRASGQRRTRGGGGRFVPALLLGHCSASTSARRRSLFPASKTWSRAAESAHGLQRQSRRVCPRIHAPGPSCIASTHGRSQWDRPGGNKTGQHKDSFRGVAAGATHPPQRAVLLRSSFRVRGSFAHATGREDRSGRSDRSPRWDKGSGARIKGGDRLRKRGTSPRQRPVWSGRESFLDWSDHGAASQQFRACDVADHGPLGPLLRAKARATSSRPIPHTVAHHTQKALRACAHFRQPTNQPTNQK